MASYSREQFSGTKNRMLLWHGSRLTNWTGILSQGLSFFSPVSGSWYWHSVWGLSFSLLFMLVVKDIWMGVWVLFVNHHKIWLRLVLNIHQVCVLLHLKHPWQVTCLERGFTLLTCSPKVQIIAMLVLPLQLGFCFYARFGIKSALMIIW